MYLLILKFLLYNLRNCIIFVELFLVKYLLYEKIILKIYNNDVFTLLTELKALKYGTIFF